MRRAISLSWSFMGLLFFASPFAARAQTALPLAIGGQSYSASKSAVAMYGFAGLKGLRVQAVMLAKGNTSLTLYDPEGKPLATKTARDSVAVTASLARDGIFMVGVARTDSAETYLLRLIDVTPGRAPVRGYVNLHQAVQDGDLKAAAAFIDLGADVSGRDAVGRTPLAIAAMSINMPLARTIPILRLLLEKGAEVDAFSRSTTTPLQGASVFGNVQAVRLLLEAGADVHGAGGASPLDAAVTNGHLAVVRLLIEKGADVNERDEKFGSTPLHRAAGGESWRVKPSAYVGIIDALVAAGADMNATDNRGRTPLDVAKWRIAESKRNGRNDPYAASILRALEKHR